MKPDTHLLPGFAALAATAILVCACAFEPQASTPPPPVESARPVAVKTVLATPAPAPATVMPTPTRRPPDTATPHSPPTPAPGRDSLTTTPLPKPEPALPGPTLFNIAWDDRAVFKKGLIPSAQPVLGQLPGASIYHIDLHISGDMAYLTGKEEVRYTNREDEPLTQIYFRLFPSLAGGPATVLEMFVNDRPVEPVYELQNSAVRVPLDSPLRPGEQVVLRLGFRVEIPRQEGGNYGTFAYARGVLALAHVYPMIPVYDDEGWNVEIAPEIGDVIYADSSFYLVRVTAPVTLTIAASGIETGRERGETQQVVTFAAGPVRDFYLAASEQYTQTRRTVGETTVNSFTTKENAAGAELALNHAVAALESFNRRFGPYPFTEFDMVSTTTFALGVEYPGIVALLEDLYDPTGVVGGTPAGVLLEAVVAHEVAHQWFYSVVGNDQVDEPWLDEALAQYATLLYYLDVHGGGGAAGFRGSLERRWNRVNRADIPIGLPVRAYTPQQYSAIVYGRGPLFLEALAQEMGQQEFEAFLKDYVQTYRWGIATGAGFKELAQTHCRCNLAPLFETWVEDQQKSNN